MTRVLFLSSLWPPAVVGGAETYAGRLAAELAVRGDEVGAVTLGVDGPSVVAAVPPRPYRLDEFASQPLSRRAAYHFADLYRPDAARAVRRAIASFRPDVVHSHVIHGLSISALIAPSRLGVAHVHTLHDYWLLCQRSTMVARDGRPCARRCVTCRAFSNARRAASRRGFPHVVVAPSEAIAREHAAFAPVAERVRVIRHPVEPVGRAPRREGGARIGYLGQLVSIKGVETLLRAFSALPNSSALVVAGEGPLRSAVASEAGERVEYLGWLDEDGRERFFSGIDCLVVPSEWKEPAPLVVNEAAARGVPVIGSAIGGIPELVPEPCRELLFRPGDAGDLAAKLTRFLADPGRYAFEPPAWGWDDHLAAVRTAYADAARAAST
jgi:glycosyltransferase involved in cell wall biosynthesis